MGFDLVTFNLIMWGIMAFTTSLSMMYTLFRHREKQLDSRVRLMIFGMMMAWLGNSIIPFEWLIQGGTMWLSTLIIVFGGLVNIQILLEWKFGKWIWLKILSVAVFVAFFGVFIHGLM